MSMFEKAARTKLRFQTPAGLITTEDLWDLPLLGANGMCLDEVARNYNRQVKDAQEESFVTPSATADSIVVLKLDVVKHVIKVKLDEQHAAENAAVTKAQKEKILGIMAAKQDEALTETSMEDLKKMLEEL